MRFLVQKDYNRLISDADLNTVFNDTTTGQTYTIQQRIIDTEPAAQEEICSFIKQRFDISLIFTDTPVYSGAATYYGNSRVQYHEAPFSAATIYTINQRISYLGSIYFSIAGSAAHAFNPSEWTFICLDYQLFYGILPAPTFQYFTKYSIGTVVWNPYDNRTYTSRVNNNWYALSDTTKWTQNAVYSFTAELPTNGTYWIQGDNRNPMLVQKMVDIVLYHGLANITNRFEPEVRIRRYKGEAKENYVLSNDNSALGWLTKICDGKLNATLPDLPPKQEELSLRWHNQNGDNNTNWIDTPKMTY